jgi:signal transduction histidine kinase
MCELFDRNTLLSLTSSLFCLCLVVFFLRKSRNSALTTSFLIYLTLVLLYPLDGVIHNMLIALGIYGQEYHRWICRTLQYFTISYIGTSLLIFCLYYTSNNPKINRIISFLMLMVTTAFFIIILLKKYDIYSLNGLYTELFWYKTLSLFSFMAAGIVLLFISHARKTGYEKKQSSLLLAAISIPLLIIMLQAYLMVSGKPLPLINDPSLVPLSFTISCLMIAISSIKYRFLNLSAITSRKIHENMKDAYIAIDNSGTIIDVNQPLILMFPQDSSIRKNGDATAFYKALTAYALPGPGLNMIMADDQAHFNIPASTEITLILLQIKTYMANAQPIIINKNDCIGRIISFSDVTEYKSLLQELNNKNAKLTEIKNELIAANLQLREHASTIEQLAIVRERNRLTREIHDSLGHTLTLLLTLLKASQITLQQNPGDTGNKLEEAVEITKAGLKELKCSIMGISDAGISQNDFLLALNRLSKEAEEAGTRVDISIDGSNNVRCELYTGILYRLCREAITNSLRHGGAKHISIVLCFYNEAIKLLIIDDGFGCDNFVEGFGLAGIRKSIQNVNGKIEYGSGEDVGFSIYAEIPIEIRSEQGVIENA